MDDLERRCTAVATELLGGFRALVVNGPRQAGKSTVVRHVQAQRGPVANLDDPSLLDLARHDPVGFLAQLDRFPAIDEFQRAGEPLLLALKMVLDSDNARGQFLLAGSTRFLSTRRLSETLTGRIGIVELLPLSVGETLGIEEHFVDQLFSDDGPLGLSSDPLQRRDYADRIAVGGFPELVLGPATTRFRSSWAGAYVATVTAASNVDEVASVRRPEVVGGLLRQIAARSSAELVIADLARELTIDERTVREYVEILETLYLARSVPAWTTSRTTRAKHRRVGHVIDTAIACFLLGVTGDDLAQLGSPWIGPLLESFVVGEVAKQLVWVDSPTQMLHYRDRDQREVDIVLERGQRVAAVEVKATSTPTLAHARHLAFLRDRLGARFVSGVVLHTGTQRLQLADRIAAVPVSTLWGH